MRQKKVDKKNSGTYIFNEMANVKLFDTYSSLMSL